MSGPYSLTLSLWLALCHLDAGTAPMVQVLQRFPPVEFLEAQIALSEKYLEWLAKEMDAERAYDNPLAARPYSNRWLEMWRCCTEGDRLKSIYRQLLRAKGSGADSIQANVAYFRELVGERNFWSGHLPPILPVHCLGEIAQEDLEGRREWYRKRKPPGAAPDPPNKNQ